MHLVGFTIEIYYIAWPYECQKCFSKSLCVYNFDLLILYLYKVLCVNISLMLVNICQNIW